MIEQRIKAALAENKLSVNKLSQILNINQTTLNDQLRGRTKLTVETLELILPHLDNISMEWLIRGEGKMDKGHIITQMLGKVLCDGNGDVWQFSGGDEALKATIKALKEENYNLRKEQDDLRAQRDKLQGTVDDLTKALLNLSSK